MTDRPETADTPDRPLPEGWTRNADGTLNAPVITCSKCGAKGMAFICDTRGCPVNGGAFYG